jgi:phosphoglycerate dehydrogenase-like enzyme
MDTTAPPARPFDVLVTSRLPEALRRQVADAAGAGVRVHYETDAPAIVSRLAGLPAPAAILAGAFSPEILAAWPAGGRRWLHSTGAGVERLLFPELVASDVVVTNSRGAHRVAMPEFVLMAMLAWTHHLPALIRAQSRREWIKPVPGEVAGKTLGLLGYGEIGRAVAARAGALGVRCLALRRNPGAAGPSGVERVYGPEAIGDFLGECDFVVNSLPLTAETRGLLDGRALRAMRPDAVLINLGRGPTVVEADLLRALREGWIGGAVLDVFDVEPLPPDSPFWALENVLITAHTSGNSAHYLERAVDIFCDNLKRFGAGEPLRNLVDKGLGY